MLRKISRVLVALVSVLSMASAATAQSDNEWKNVIEAAKKEGKVVFYTGAVASPFHKEIGAAFEKEYGIKFEVLEARASELRERISTEQAAGRFLGDVHHNGSTTTSLMIKAGNLQPVGSIPNSKNLTQPFLSDEYRIPSYVLTYGILVNSDLVKEGVVPKTWKDLLDARWTGKILSDDMRALGGGSVFFMVMHDTFGRDFHEQLATQRPVFTRDMRNAERRVAQGEYSFYIPQLLTFYTILKPGLPLKFVIPKEGTPYIRYDLTVLKNAPHPNAARLFINFMLKPESQLILANGGVKPVVSNVIELANPALRELLNAPALGTTEVERQNEMLKLANEIYK